MKKTFYFQHDYNARNDPKLQDVLSETGVAGLGVFWCIVEMLYEQDGTLDLRSCKSIAFALHTDAKLVESIVKDYNLFENDGEKFWSNSVLTRLNTSRSIASKRKAAALSRWKPTPEMQMQSKCNPNAMQMQCKSTVKESKEKESKEESLSNDKEKESKKRKAFLPPSLEEVQAYIKEKGYSIDAEAFIAFYSSKNWYVGSNKMTNWRMAVVTWSKRNNAGATRATRSATTKNCNDEWK
jgi:hypothetical protein